jgi:hypothetical protein
MIMDLYKYIFENYLKNDGGPKINIFENYLKTDGGPPNNIYFYTIYA